MNTYRYAPCPATRTVGATMTHLEGRGTGDTPRASAESILLLVASSNSAGHTLALTISFCVEGKAGSDDKKICVRQNPPITLHFLT